MSFKKDLIQHIKKPKFAGKDAVLGLGRVNNETTSTIIARPVRLRRHPFQPVPRIERKVIPSRGERLQVWIDTGNGLRLVHDSPDDYEVQVPQGSRAKILYRRGCESIRSFYYSGGTLALSPESIRKASSAQSVAQTIGDDIQLLNYDMNMARIQNPNHIFILTEFMDYLILPYPALPDDVVLYKNNERLLLTRPYQAAFGDYTIEYMMNNGVIRTVVRLSQAGNAGDIYTVDYKRIRARKMWVFQQGGYIFFDVDEGFRPHMSRGHGLRDGFAIESGFSGVAVNLLDTAKVDSSTPLNNAITVSIKFYVAPKPEPVIYRVLDSDFASITLQGAASLSWTLNWTLKLYYYNSTNALSIVSIDLSQYYHNQPTWVTFTRFIDGAYKVWVNGVLVVDDKLTDFSRWKLDGAFAIGGGSSTHPAFVSRVYVHDIAPSNEDIAVIHSDEILEDGLMLRWDFDSLWVTDTGVIPDITGNYDGIYGNGVRYCIDVSTRNNLKHNGILWVNTNKSESLLPSFPIDDTPESYALVADGNVAVPTIVDDGMTVVGESAVKITFPDYYSDYADCYVRGDLESFYKFNEGERVVVDFFIKGDDTSAGKTIMVGIAQIDDTTNTIQNVLASREVKLYSHWQRVHLELDAPALDYYVLIIWGLKPQLRATKTEWPFIEGRYDLFYEVEPSGMNIWVGAIYEAMGGIEYWWSSEHYPPRILSWNTTTANTYPGVNIEDVVRGKIAGLYTKVPEVLVRY